MPSFRTFIHHTTGQRWAIARDGSNVVLRIGEPADQMERSRQYKDDVSAAAALEVLIDEQLTEGFIEQKATVGPREPPPALSDALRAVGIDARSVRVLGVAKASPASFVVEQPGFGVIGTWRALRDRVETTGYYPIVLGDRDLEVLAERVAGCDPQATIERASTFDLEGWMVAQLAQVSAPNLSRGKPPVHAEPRQWFTCYLQPLTTQPLARVGLALVPTKNSWEAGAFLDFGRSNSDEPGWGAISSHAAVALLHRWNTEFGAEPVGMTSDILEMHVARPCKDMTRALSLAREHLAFCADEVAQNAESLERLAELVCKATVWHFWWD